MGFIPYIGMFLWGVMATGLAIWGRKIYVERKKRRQEQERYRASAEKDGWMKTKGYSRWSDRTKMEKWCDDMRDDLEMSTWLKENTKSYFKLEWINGSRYIKFDNDEDALAFKLMWS